MNYSNILNQSKIKNSKVNFEASQVQGKSNIYSDKDNSQNTSNLGTKFSYTDPLNQAYLNKVKKKPEIDKASFYSNKYAVPIVQTDLTQIVETQIKEDSYTVSQIKLNAIQNTNTLRKQEKLQNSLRLQQKLEFSRQKFLQEVQENLSFNKLEDISIAPTQKYQESLINQMNQARENMLNAEFKHTNLLEENIGLKKQVQLLKDGIELQNIRFKYYIQSAYNMLRGDSIFMLDERLFYILLKTLLTELEPQKINFNQKLVATLDAINLKVNQNSKSLQSLIVDNETVLKFLDHDLNLEHFSTHLTAETLEQLEKQDEKKQEAIIKALHTVISEKVMEIEKYRIADNNSRQMINLLTAKSEEYEKHIQNMMISAENEPLKNNLKRIIELKKDNDFIVSENESLKKTIQQYEDSNKNLTNENDYLQERCIIYSKKILQLLLDQNMSEEAVKNQMDQILQQENLDFYLKKRNMEFIKEKYSENSEVQKKNNVQGQEIESLQQQIEYANQTIEQLEKKLIDETQNKGSIAGIINLDDTNQLQHTIQQLSLILLSKDNAVKVDQTTQRVIKQMFSENFDQMVEFQQETIDNLKIKLNEIEQKYFQSESKRIDYLNISFYLSNILVNILDSQKESQIKGKLQKERNQIINFYGKCVQDFQDLVKLQNPKNINPVNQWYVNKLKDNSKELQENSPQTQEKLKSADENILSDLTILQQMGVKPLQEYINMRIGRVEEENAKLKENLKNIKKENVTVAELKKQRLLDEERYERLSKQLKAFCSDNIFTASENNDLIGHYNEEFLLTMFIQANTIEEMISKTLENDEDEAHSRPSLQNDNNQIQKQDSQRDSDPRNNLPPLLNHSIIEEKPGEEDEFIENGKRVKVRNSYRNLSSSGHSQQDPNHQREGSGQAFDQKIQINISISSPDRSLSSSFSGQAPIMENQAQKMQQIEDTYSKKQYYQQSQVPQKYYEEDLSYNKQYNNNNKLVEFQGQDSDLVASRSIANTIQQSQQIPPSKQLYEYQQQQIIQQNQSIKNAEQIQQQQKQQEQQYNNSLEQQTFISNSQTPSFKNTPKSTTNNSLSNIQQLNMAQLQQNFSNVRQTFENEEYMPRSSKPMQYSQQQSIEEKQRSNKSSKQSSIHQVQEIADINKQNINQEIGNEKLSNQQQQQRLKEIQDLKRFSAQSTMQQFIDPQFKKRASDSQVNQMNFNKEEAIANLTQSPKQNKVSNSQVISSLNKDQLSLSKNSQEGQKIFQETIGQISDIKPTSKKMIDDDNKTSFNEDHFEMLFGKKNEESIEQQGDDSDNQSPPQNHKNYIHNQNRKLKQNLQQQRDYDNDDGYNEDRESEYNNYEPQSDEEAYNNQEQSRHQYQEYDDEDYDEDNHHDDSLEQEAPYLNQNK